MKKQFAISALKELKDFHKKTKKLTDLGISITTFSKIEEQLVESIARMFSENEKQVKQNIDDINWWLYERTSKIIIYSNGYKKDLTKVADFVEWLNRER